MASNPQAVLSAPVLSELQQAQLWDLWIGAATRSLYFSILANKFSKWQNFIQGAAIVMSGSACAALLLDPHASMMMPLIAPFLPYMKFGLPITSAILNAVGLGKQYTKRSFECSELYQKWGRLAQECQRLWGDMYTQDAPDKLNKLLEKELEIAGPSTRSMPNKRRLMAKCQDEATQKIQNMLGVNNGNDD
jgi:hypothetical protein